MSDPVGDMNHELACLDERFTGKLHRLLEDAECLGFEEVLRWNPDGRSFTIYQPKVFAHIIMSAYFKHTKYKSFQRQLNLYDFRREKRDGIRGVCKSLPVQPCHGCLTPLLIFA
jgi:hypothetical protein